MHKNELIFQKLDNPELIKVAKTLKNEGIILQNENYAYLKISEDFIHKLYPLIAEHENLQKPDYFSEKCAIGTHITITYPNEEVVINDQNLNHYRLRAGRLMIGTRSAVEFKLKLIPI